MSNNKIRSPSIGKLKVQPLKPGSSPSISPRPMKSKKNRVELSRSTKIKIKKTPDATEKTEYTIVFDDLEPGDLLGRGQFGTVKRMYHKESDLTFAVKMIMDSNMDNSNDKRNSEIMDLEVPLKLGDGCPNLIRFYGALHAESYIWILTEVMDTSLDRFYLKMKALERPMPELFISKVAQAVLSALEYMKQFKLMHRDIKPSNVLINAAGDIKVCDFGISGFTTNSVCSTFKGCQRYMPPEKIDPMGASSYTAKADIWSLGISLVEIATCEHPFGEAQGILGLIKCITAAESPKLDAAKFSPQMCSFVDKCLFKIPEERSSCGELLKDEFIVKYLEDKSHLEMVREVIDQIKLDKIEA